MRYTLLLGLLVCLFSDFGGSLTYNCPNRYEKSCDYTQFNPVNDGLKINTMTSMAFQTSGSNDAYILLQHDNNELKSNVIEILIGGWGNSRSEIRTEQQGSHMAEYSGTILSSSLQWFWISWNSGCVKVGKGSSVGDSQIMKWCGLTYIINGIRFCYAFKGTGTFVIPPYNPCFAPPVTSNGSLKYSSTDHGATATYTCNAGYHITAGSETSKCSDGTWSDSTPTCGDIDECVLGTCKNGATCDNSLGGYKCACSPGWQGTKCNVVAGVEITTSQNDVRFVNIEGKKNISINIQLADKKSIAYIRLYINDTTENQATIIIGRSLVEVILCNGEGCTHNRTTVPINQSQLIEITLDNDYKLVGANCVLQLKSTQTSVLQSECFTKLALLSLTGEASFKIVPQMDTVPQSVNNSKEQIEFSKVMFPLTMPLIDQPKGSPPTTTPSDKYPGLTPVVPTYRNSLSKSLHRINDERSLSNQLTSGASGGSNSSSKEECLTDCYCPCGWVEEPKNYTQNEIATIVAAIQERLKVDLKNLTSTKRKLNSVPDNRPLAKAVGVAGVIFLVLILGAIFIFDIMNIIRGLKTLRNNLRQRFGCKAESPKQTTVAPFTSM